MERKLTGGDETDNRNEELCELIRQNDPYALTELLENNEGLIFQLAQSMETAHDLEDCHYGGIEFEDIIQEGRIALIEAAQSFDKEADTKFSTFAYVVIRNAMHDLCRKADASFEKRLARHGRIRVFLDKPQDDDNDDPEYERVQDGRVHDLIGDEAVLRVMIQKMHNRLKLLPPRERKIIMYRYGIGSLQEKTVSETAAYFHLTDKHVRIIESRALASLRVGMNDGKVI